MDSSIEQAPFATNLHKERGTIMENRTFAQLNEAVCPVTDEFLGQLHRASDSEAIEFTRPLPESQRARLAAFCYKRTHLHGLGLMIASTCSCNALFDAAGFVGRVIYDRSREPRQAPPIDMLNPAHHPRMPASPISLATLDGEKVAV